MKSIIALFMVGLLTMAFADSANAAVRGRHHHRHHYHHPRHHGHR